MQGTSCVIQPFAISHSESLLMDSDGSFALKKEYESANEV